MIVIKGLKDLPKFLVQLFFLSKIFLYIKMYIIKKHYLDLQNYLFLGNLKLTLSFCTFLMI